MRQDKNLAIALRKEGKSYKEITRLTGIPKSTLCGWLEHMQWSKAIKSRLTKIQNQNARLRMIAITDKAREQRRALYQSHRDGARKDFQANFKDTFFVAGLMLYWGEGDNAISNGAIRISNADPMVLKFFRAFVCRYLSEIYPKLKISLVLYPDLKDTPSRKYWSEKVGMPLDKFMKSQYIEGRSSKRTLPYGVGLLFVTNKAYKHTLLEWIEQARQHIKHAGIV